MVRIVALLALAMLCLPLAGPSGEAQSAPPSYDFSAVTTLIQNTVNNQGLEGASLILVKDGRTIYEEYFGSYSATTIVPIASSTKWLSAGAFMTLVDDGIIALDDPVSQYLPEWTGQMGAITMRQLWSFTSGLVDNHACMDDTTTTLANCVEHPDLANRGGDLSSTIIFKYEKGKLLTHAEGTPGGANGDQCRDCTEECAVGGEVGLAEDPALPVGPGLVSGRAPVVPLAASAAIAAVAAVALGAGAWYLRRRFRRS